MNSKIPPRNLAVDYRPDSDIVAVYMYGERFAINAGGIPDEHKAQFAHTFANVLKQVDASASLRTQIAMQKTLRELLGIRNGGAWEQDPNIHSTEKALDL